MPAASRPTRLGAARSADAVAQAWIDAEAYRLHTLWTATRVLDGRHRRARGQRQQDPLVRDRPRHPPRRPRRCSGPEAERHGAGVDDTWLDGYLFALAGPIYAGTNEIQRNVVAERMLGLPRG